VPDDRSQYVGGALAILAVLLLAPASQDEP
jgi:hypothetical protein